MKIGSVDLASQGETPEEIVPFNLAQPPFAPRRK